MAFGSFPIDVFTRVSPLDMLLPLDSFERDRSAARSSARQFHETDTEYTLSLALPGVSPADLKLAVEDGVLTISGTTKLGTQEYNAAHRVRVPRDADPTLAKAAAENGILSISLPKRPKQTHEITVASSTDGLPKAAEGDCVLNLPFPGVRPSDFKVVCEDGVLSIAVETNSAHHATRSLKRMRLPENADVAAAAAAAEHGILTIIVPRGTTEAPKEVLTTKSTQHIAITNSSSEASSQ